MFTTNSSIHVTLGAFPLLGVGVAARRREAQSGCPQGMEWRYGRVGVPECKCPANTMCTGETTCSIAPQAQEEWQVTLVSAAVCSPPLSAQQQSSTSLPLLETSSVIPTYSSPANTTAAILKPQLTGTDGETTQVYLALGLVVGLCIPILLGLSCPHLLSTVTDRCFRKSTKGGLPTSGVAANELPQQRAGAADVHAGSRPPPHSDSDSARPQPESASLPAERMQEELAAVRPPAGDVQDSCLNHPALLSNFVFQRPSTAMPSDNGRTVVADAPTTSTPATAAQKKLKKRKTGLGQGSGNIGPPQRSAARQTTTSADSPLATDLLSAAAHDEAALRGASAATVLPMPDQISSAAAAVMTRPNRQRKDSAASPRPPMPVPYQRDSAIPTSQPLRRATAKQPLPDRSSGRPAVPEQPLPHQRGSAAAQRDVRAAAPMQPLPDQRGSTASTAAQLLPNQRGRAAAPEQLLPNRSGHAAAPASLVPNQRGGAAAPARLLPSHDSDQRGRTATAAKLLPEQRRRAELDRAAPAAPPGESLHCYASSA
jgi:hypothetical protein